MLIWAVQVKSGPIGSHHYSHRSSFLSTTIVGGGTRHLSVPSQLNPEPEFVNVQKAQDSIPRKRIHLPKCSLRLYFKTFKEARSQFKGIDSASLCSLADRYDNPFPTRFLAPLDCSKISALAARYDSSIPTRFLAPIDCSKIPGQFRLGNSLV
jgi:hypothetical protein